MQDISSIQLLSDALDRLHLAKATNKRFGAILELQHLIEFNARMTHHRVLRHAWLILGVQS